MNEDGRAVPHGERHVVNIEVVEEGVSIVRCLAFHGTGKRISLPLCGHRNHPSLREVLHRTSLTPRVKRYKDALKTHSAGRPAGYVSASGRPC